MAATDPDREDEMPAAAIPETGVEAPYTIEEDGGDLVVRVPRWLASAERMSRFLDWLHFEQLRGQSQLTEADAAELAREVKHAVWKANRHRAGAP